MEWMHIRKGWPLTYPNLGDAPAEFAAGVLYLLRTEEAAEASDPKVLEGAILDFVQSMETREYRRLAQQSGFH